MAPCAQRKMSSKYRDYRNSISPGMSAAAAPDLAAPPGNDSKGASPEDKTSRPCSPTSEPEDNGDGAATASKQQDVPAAPPDGLSVAEAAAAVATPGPECARLPAASPTGLLSPSLSQAQDCETTLSLVRQGELSPREGALRLYSACDKTKPAGLKERVRLLKDSGRWFGEKELRSRTQDASQEERAREYQAQAHLRLVCAVGPAEIDPPAPIDPVPKKVLKELTKILAPLSFEMNMMEDGEKNLSFNLWVERSLARPYVETLPQTVQMLMAKYKLALSTTASVSKEPAPVPAQEPATVSAQKRQPRRTPSAAPIRLQTTTGQKVQDISGASPPAGDIARAAGRGPRRIDVDYAGGDVDSESDTPKAAASEAARGSSKKREALADSDGDADGRSGGQKRRRGTSRSRTRRVRTPAERARMQAQVGQALEQGKLLPTAGAPSSSSSAGKPRLVRRATELPVASGASATQQPAADRPKRALSSAGTAGARPQQKLRRTVSAPLSSAAAASAPAGSARRVGVQALNKFSIAAPKLAMRMEKMKAEAQKKKDMQRRQQEHEQLRREAQQPSGAARRPAVAAQGGARAEGRDRSDRGGAGSGRSRSRGQHSSRQGSRPAAQQPPERHGAARRRQHSNAVPERAAGGSRGARPASASADADRGGGDGAAAVAKMQPVMRPADGARDDEVLIKESPLQQGETGAAEPPPLDLASGAAAGGAAASSAALPRFDPAAAAEPGGNGRAVSGLLGAVVAEIRSGPMRAASVPPASPAASPFVFVAESPLF